jgi:hypothetical protein
VSTRSEKDAAQTLHRDDLAEDDLDHRQRAEVQLRLAPHGHLERLRLADERVVGFELLHVLDLHDLVDGRVELLRDVHARDGDGPKGLVVRQRALEEQIGVKGIEIRLEYGVADGMGHHVQAHRVCRWVRDDLGDHGQLGAVHVALGDFGEADICSAQSVQFRIPACWPLTAAAI